MAFDWNALLISGISGLIVGLLTVWLGPKINHNYSLERLREQHKQKIDYMRKEVFFKKKLDYFEKTIALIENRFDSINTAIVELEKGEWKKSNEILLNTMLNDYPLIDVPDLYFDSTELIENIQKYRTKENALVKKMGEKIKAKDNNKITLKKLNEMHVDMINERISNINCMKKQLNLS